MASLGSFSVELLANIARFESDLGKAHRIAERRAQDMRRALGSVAGALGVGLSGAAFTKFIKSTIDATDQLSKMSAMVGVPIESLGRLKHAAQLADVELGELQGGLGQLIKRSSEAAQGNEALSKSFEAIGVSTSNADGSLRDVESLLGDVADVFKVLPAGAEQTRLAFDLFGRSGAKLIPMLDEGREGFKAAGDEAQRFGLIVNEQAGKRAEEFNDDLLRLRLAAEGLGTQIGVQLVPEMQILLGQMTEFAREGGTARGVASFVSNEISGIAKAIRLTGEEFAYLGALKDKLSAALRFDQQGFDSAIERMETASRNLSDPSFAVGGFDASDVIDAGEQMQVERAAREKNAKAIEQEKARLEELMKSLRVYYSDSTDATAAAEEFTRELQENQKAAEAVTAEFDEFARRQEDIAAELAGPSAQAALAYKREMEDLQSKVDRGVISADEMTVAQANLGEQLKRTTQAIKQQQQAPQQLLAAMKQELQLLGMTTEERNRAVASLRAEEAMRSAIAEAQGAGADLLTDQVDALVEMAKATSEAIEEASELESILSSFDDIGMSGLLRDLDRVKRALKEAESATGDAFDPERVARLQTALGYVRQETLLFATDAIGKGITSLQSMADEGSDAFKRLETAQLALNVVSAIGAVLNQGKGDPYTAFARMAAMAAAVAALVGNIAFNGGSGGFSDTAEQRQETQGTGTILGEADAKSESILNAMEITADATTQLVGINRGMLRALQTLESGLGSAAGMLARGAGDVDFGALPAANGIIPRLLGSSLPGSILGSLLGGSSEVTDQGIVIMGGVLGDLIENIAVGSYREVQSRSWRFGSRRTRESVVDVTDQFGDQFQLIIESIANTVREGAAALGLLPAEIEAAIEAFRVEEIRISLMDLSAEEQQAELAAVFSSIFDGLAGNVVPFIEQFQQLGEGLGETLVRVATGVQVTQEAMIQLGFSLEAVGPERFAQISEGLIGLAGGVDEFIAGMTTFVQAFATEEHQFMVAQDAITRAFEQFGLTVPATRDAMWALMQSLDATTEEGQEQIAMLLRLAGVADSYYSMLEEQAEAAAEAIQFNFEAAMRYVDLVRGINDQIAALDGTSKFQLGLRDIAANLSANLAAMHEAARAAGLQAAREQDLARAHQLAALQAAQAAAQLEEAGRALAAELYGTAIGDIDAEIAALEAQSNASATAVSGFGDAMSEVADAANEATRLLLGDLSPLRDRAKLPLALDALRRGEVSADQVLGIGQRLMASGADYNQLFAQVMAIVQSRGTTGSGPAGPVGANFAMQAQLEMLRDQRAEMQAQQDQARRFSQASELAQIVADLAGFRGEEFAAVLESLTGGQATFEQFAADLGLGSISELEAYLETLQANSYTIADIASTVTAGDQLIVDTLRAIFEEQQQIDLTKPILIEPVDPKSLGAPDWQAEQELTREELRLLREEMAAMRSASEQTAVATTSTATSAGQLVGDRAADRSVVAGFVPRSTRGMFSKPKVGA